MARILIVDDKSIVRELLSSCLRQAGYETSCAAGGQAALEAIAATGAPDLMMLELMLPEFDGLSVLRVLRKQKSSQALPVFLITRAPNRQMVLDAAKLGICGCMLKDKFSLADLLGRIEHILKRPATAPAAVAAAPTPPAPAGGGAAGASDADAKADALAKTLGVTRLLTREKCMERAEKALQGKALSGVVAQVIQLVTSSRTEMTQIAECIGHDPMLTAKVLRVANSAVYTSGRGPVTSIPHAIRNVGFSTVRNIATTIGVFDAMPKGSKETFDPIRCWQHSFGVGILCERFSADSKQPGAGAVAYLAGLCHDLGEILFQSCFGAEYKQVLEAQERTGHPIAQIAEAMLGVGVSELMLLTLRSLQLPDAIRTPIEAMHGNGPDKDRLGSALRLADIYANGMQLAASAKSPVRSFTKAECEQALGTANGPALDREQIRSEILALTSLLTHVDDGSIGKPLFPQTKAKVWLARELGFSPLDPVEAALDSVGHVQVSGRLPNAREIEGLTELVVSSQSSSSGTLNGLNVSALRAACQNRLPVLRLVAEGETGSPEKISNVPESLPMPVTLETVAKLLAA